jgi:hypothetical protein
MFVVNATTMLRVNQGERREHQRCHFLLALSGREPAHVLLGGCLGDSELAAARRGRESTALRSGLPPSYSPPLSRSAEPIAIRIPDLEFVASSIGQRRIGEKPWTELEEASASCGSAAAKALSASGADGRSPRSTALRNVSAVTV